MSFSKEEITDHIQWLEERIINEWDMDPVVLCELLKARDRATSYLKEFKSYLKDFK